MKDTIGINHKWIKDLQEEKKESIRCKTVFEAQMVEMNAQLQRQKFTFDKHIDDLEKPLLYAMYKIKMKCRKDRLATKIDRYSYNTRVTD